MLGRRVGPSWVGARKERAVLATEDGSPSIHGSTVRQQAYERFTRRHTQATPLLSCKGML